MDPLQRPDRERARKILREVSFRERLICHRVRERMGPTVVALYSLEEVLHFLSTGIPQIDFDRLAEWTRETLGDGELADRMEETVRRAGDGPEGTGAARHLVALRLLQCREAVGLRRP